MLRLLLIFLVVYPLQSQSDQQFISSFHPDTPSPTHASPPIRSRIRFIDQDDFAPSANPFQSQESYFPVSAPAVRRPRILSDFLETSASEPNAGYLSQSEDIDEDRWRWPSRREQRQSPEFVGLQSLEVHRSVPKSYRFHSKESSCPKLLHDLSISCQLPDDLKQHQNTVVFRWYKTLYLDAASSGNLLERAERKLIADRSSVQISDSRYGIRQLAPDSETLTIRRLKVADCGSYTCEAIHYNGTTLSTSDFQIFLCY